MVPLELTGTVTPFRRCMKGTDLSRPRCIALVGEIGGQNYCSIYAVRPTPCRDFRAAWEVGVSEEEAARCNQARARHRLAPISQPASQ